MALNLDLAFADARALAARLGCDGCLRLVLARAEDGATARIDFVVLGPAISDRLRVDAAHHGEWRVADPHPDGFSRLRWWRESMRSGRPRLARGDLAGAPVVVIAPSEDGRAPADAPDRADLELDFPRAAPARRAGRHPPPLRRRRAAPPRGGALRSGAGRHPDARRRRGMARPGGARAGPGGPRAHRRRVPAPLRAGAGASNALSTAARSGPQTIRCSRLRTCETEPTRSPAGLWMPMRAPT